MLRNTFRLLALLCAGLGTSSIVSAQPIAPNQANKPVFSPYLNLLRGGNTALNYYGSVLPLQQYDQSIGRIQNTLQQQSRDLQQLEQLGSGGGVSGYNPYLRSTGYVASFDSLGGYFDRIGGGGGSSFGGIGGGGSGFGGSMQPAFSNRPGANNRSFGIGGVGGAGIGGGAGAGGFGVGVGGSGSAPGFRR